jgi:short-subunit dehydrogenase
MGTVMILGATSGIARAVAASYAKRGHPLLLLGRDMAELQAIAADLAIRHGVSVTAHRFDALAYDTHESALSQAIASAPAPLEGAVVAFGYLGDQAKGQADWAEAQRILDTNFTAAASTLTHLGNHLEAQRSGWLCVLSSVAGDRGRQSNYLYGSAKAGLTAFLSGLRARLFKAGVHVTTIKPGFVDTGMTFGKPGMFLVASPDHAAEGIVKAVSRRRDSAYVPGFWALIMLIIRSVPEPVFKRTKL